MHSLMFVIFILGVLCLETSFAQSNCEIKSDSGRIFDTQIVRPFKRVENCWVIKVPAETKAIIEVSKLTINRTLFASAQLTIGNHLLEASLRSKFQTLGLSDTTVIFRAENNRNNDEIKAEFDLNFNVVSLACDQFDAFHCTETECVPKSSVCNGVNDCSNGADEKECGTTASPTDDTGGIEVEDILGLKESREKTLQLLHDLRFRNGGWRENTPRALIAIHLANDTNFNENLYQQLIAKDLELQILENTCSRDSSKHDLGTYINALVAICVKPEKFRGYNLLEILHDELNYTNTYDDNNGLAYLAKCISGELLSEDELVWLEEVSGHLPFQDDTYEIDNAYYAVMAVACATRQGQHLDTTIFDDISEKIMLHQRYDGSFDRDVTTTAIYVQILMALNKIDDTTWSYEMAVKYLMREMEKSKDLNEVLFTLPVLGGRTMADIRCNGRSRKETGMEENESEKTLSLRDGENKFFSINMEVEENITAIKFIEFAAMQHPMLSIRWRHTDDKTSICEIADIADNTTIGKYWQFYYIKSDEDQNVDSTQDEAIYTEKKLDEGLDEFTMKDVKELILWYKELDVEKESNVQEEK